MNPQEAIKALVRAGWTEAAMAKEVGVSQPTIHRIKHGQQRRGASFETCTALIALAASLPVADQDIQQGSPPDPKSIAAVAQIAAADSTDVSEAA
jgi:DNA-binding XRE family transcriptional regulator